MSEKALGQPTHKFLTLDGLRGVVALAVFQYHVSLLFGGSWFPHGYLAVDFFFMLSGFVLTFAYQSRLDSGWSTLSFIRARLIRLYPLYFLGLALGVLAVVVHWPMEPVHDPASSIAGLILLGLLMLPAPAWVGGVSLWMFPYNPQTWSLFFELVANLLHAIALRRRRLWIIALAVFIALCLLVALSQRFHTLDFGLLRGDIPAGIVRVGFSYGFGIGIYRLWRAGLLQTGRFRLRLPAFVIACILVASMALPTSPAWKVPYELAVVGLLFPLLILAGASVEPPVALRGLFTVLGTSSYGIYVLQSPVARLYEMVYNRIFGHVTYRDAPWSGIALVVLTFILVIALDRAYDLPVRAWLRRKNPAA